MQGMQGRREEGMLTSSETEVVKATVEEPF
jgi:hypothetical protein